MAAAELDALRWYHLDGTECVAGWAVDGPRVGQCVRGGGPVTPCPEPMRVLVDVERRA